jgi:cell division protein FtsB
MRYPIIRLKNKSLIVNALIFLLIIYFGYHSLNGQRGVFAYLKLKRDLAVQAQALSEVEGEKQLYEKKIKLLNPKSIDIDLLDELARRDLGLIGEGEYIVKIPTKKSKGSL